MDNLLLLFALLTSCFLSRQIRAAEIAAVPREPTCSLGTNNRGVPLLQPDPPTCLSAAPEALNFKSHSNSSFATSAPEDRLLRLQQAVDDLLKCAVQLRATKALAFPQFFFSQISFASFSLVTKTLLTQRRKAAAVWLCAAEFSPVLSLSLAQEGGDLSAAKCLNALFFIFVKTQIEVNCVASGNSKNREFSPQPLRSFKSPLWEMPRIFSSPCVRSR